MSDVEPKYKTDEFVFVRARVVKHASQIPTLQGLQGIQNEWVLAMVNGAGKELMDTPILWIDERAIVSASEAREIISRKRKP